MKRMIRLLACAAVAGFLAAAPASAAERARFAAQRGIGELTQVKAVLEVGGDLSLKEDEQIKTLKMSVVGDMAYHERVLAVGADGAIERSVRFYDAASATIKIDQGGMQPKLRDERRWVVSVIEPERATLFCATGPFTREELDLIHIPGNSALVDQLLPSKPVTVKDRWEHPGSLLAALLGLDAVSQSSVASELIELDEAVARFEMSGDVHGAIEGIASDMEIKARYKFDRRLGRVTWFALLIKEKRSVGHVGPGADVVARLQLTIEPAASCPELSDQALADMSTLPAPEREVLEYVPAKGGYSFLHDRRWHVVSESADTAALRMVERGDLIAQCNVTALPPVAPEKRPTLAKFQEDIRRSLGQHFGGFVEASEGNSRLGHVVYRVLAEGVISELPIQWVYFLVCDAQGHMVVFAFTVETEMMPRVAGTDESIVGTVDFTAAAPAATAAAPSLAPAKQ